MNTILSTTEKKAYIVPQIELIKLDNEISLVLQSTVPDGEPTFSQARECHSDDPFKFNG